MQSDLYGLVVGIALLTSAIGYSRSTGFDTLASLDEPAMVASWVSAHPEETSENPGLP